MDMFNTNKMKNFNQDVNIQRMAYIKRLANVLLRQTAKEKRRREKATR